MSSSVFFVPFVLRAIAIFGKFRLFSYLYTLNILFEL